ncbi:MAG: 3-phosphoshikimate 1-carboxyvinyltransferase [Planctomycetes bacterium]|nr:3-phosphoshikimate 1-carboxyvinyltransferase [Planctomycetota bacterium]
MDLIVSKSTLKGTVSIPGSKSHTIRAVAIASLADGTSNICDPLISSDTLSAVDCYRALGAAIDTTDPKKWVITGTDGKVTAPDNTINVGNSGTTLRVALASAALTEPGRTITFTGDEQIQSRPLAELLNSLNDLGAAAAAVKDNDMAPVTVSGKLTGGKTTLKCLTSQYLSSLLLAAPLAENDTYIDVTLLNEPDYVQVTLDWLDKQGIKYENNDFKSFHIPGRQKYTAFDTAIPADFSSATFFLCAGAILDADITLHGLDFTDSQPDKAVADYLKAMGADITIEKGAVHIKSSTLNGTEIDMNRTPDALPAMAVTAAFAKTPTKLYNVAQARCKETDRIDCMAKELAKLGISVDQMPDGLIIHPGKISPARLEGYGDHRIVMALSLAAMAVDGESSISTAEAIDVTFPEYVMLMKGLGANMELDW